jgi:hypothetical protein
LIELGLIDLGPLSFLSPEAGLVALVVLVPLAALVVVARRARDLRSLLGLQGRGAALRVGVFALVSVGVLVGLAAAQPVWAQTRTQPVRTDAEMYFVFDTSRSMLASSGPSGRIRLDRAKDEALDLRQRFPEVPAGVASITDRPLPHLFPSPDEQSFRATVERAVAVEQPPPISFFRTKSSTLATLSAVATRGFYAPSTRRRVLVVLTDGESRPFDAAALGIVLRRGTGIKPLFVHVWQKGELVYTNGAPEPNYRPDPSSSAFLAHTASAAGGASFDEHDLSAAAAAIRRDLGSGPTRAAQASRAELALGPYVLLASALPLLFLLVRRER